MKIRFVMLGGVGYADAAGYARLLPAERREKINRLRFEKDKLLSLSAGMLIRSQIGELPLFLGEHGKPYAEGRRFFSVSHSGECAMIAVDDREIGADVEAVGGKDRSKVAGRFFHPNELEYVAKAQDRDRAFTRIWTRKEAYLKQIGTGIAADLRAFDTTSEELSGRIRSFDIGGYVISVCSEKKINDEIDISELEIKQLFSIE